MAGKNILVFRTAKHPVVLQCIEYLKEKYQDCKIFLCVQEECIEIYSNIKGVKIIKFPNGFFDYNSTMHNKKLSNILCKLKVNMVFIPYTTDKPECPEVLKIVNKYTKNRKIFYFDRFKTVRSEYLLINTIKLEWDNIINRITKRFEFVLLKIIYIKYVRR